MKLLFENAIYEIQASQKFYTFNVLSKTHIYFCGSPHGHPHDPEKIILIVNPLSTFPFYYEFRVKDISYITKLPNLVSPEGDAILMVRIWVKQGSIGIRSSPFCVEHADTVLP